MALYNGSRPLTPAAAYEMGKAQGKSAHTTRVKPNYREPACMLASRPDWAIRDHASRYFTWPAGMEMGAHAAFRRGFNEGFGRNVFQPEGLAR